MRAGWQGNEPVPTCGSPQSTGVKAAPATGNDSRAIQGGPGFITVGG